MIKANFNSDGSIKNIEINESINQGNHNFNNIEVDIEGMDSTNQTCKAEFVLPNDDKVELDANYDGASEKFKLSLPNTVTLFSGILLVNFVLIGVDSTLRTYQFPLRINPTAYEHQVEDDEEEE